MEIPGELLEALFAHGDTFLFMRQNEVGWPVTQVSSNVRELLGVDTDELLEGRRPFADLVHPDDLPMLRAAVQAAVEAGRARCEPDDYRLGHGDGRWIWVHDVSIIQRNEAGDVVRFVGHLRDVTEERRRSIELTEQHDRLRLVVEGTRLGMWDWHPQTNEVVCDERWAEMIGYRLEDIELDGWSSRVHPDDLDGCLEAMQAHMRGDTEFYDNVHRMRHKDGHWVYVLARGHVCERDEQGNATRFTGTHADITKQKLAELEAHRANQAKSEFLARMSHEIRTPLNGVLGVLQLLETTVLDEQQQQYVDVVRDSGETLLTIISDVLDTSKIEAGEMQLELRPFGCERMLRTVHELYGERAISQGIEYCLEIDSALPAVLIADEHRIRQLLSNLLSNALKFTQQGSVALAAKAGSVSADGFELILTVSDTGPGIADPEALWDPFRQADATISRRFGGTGLGLTICRQLVELMNGSIEIESEVGRGTCFRVRLPLQVGQGALAREAVRHEGCDLPALDVLVAEDNRVNQMVITAVLEQLGQHVTMVETGRAAVAECARHDFDLVLMDLHMPDMDGMTACLQIRADVPADRQPRIVAISADVFAPGNDAFAGVRFDASLSKPFKIVEIADLIRSSQVAGSGV